MPRTDPHAVTPQVARKSPRDGFRIENPRSYCPKCSGRTGRSIGLDLSEGQSPGVRSDRLTALSGLPVEPLIRDVALDGRRDLECDRARLFDALPNVSRGDADQGHLDDPHTV